LSDLGRCVHGPLPACTALSVPRQRRRAYRTPAVVAHASGGVQQPLRAIRPNTDDDALLAAGKPGGQPHGWTTRVPLRPGAGAGWFNGPCELAAGSINRVNLDALRDHARASILDANDDITSAAGIAEGSISAGSSTRTLLSAGAVVILAGGSAAAGARFSEVRTEWEMDRALLEAKRASIEADPTGEFEELVGTREPKGLDPRLARQVAEALTELDPAAAHADAELRLEAL